MIAQYPYVSTLNIEVSAEMLTRERHSPILATIFHLFFLFFMYHFRNRRPDGKPKKNAIKGEEIYEILEPLLYL